MILPHAPADALLILRDGARRLGVPLDQDAAAKMIRHLKLLQEWRTRADLTSLTDAAEILVFHFLDSLTIFKVVAVGSGYRALDIGSGGGFPGLVLKEADESLRITLLDKNPRKIVFLKHVARELNISGMEYANCTLEKLLEKPEEHQFDLVVSRAVSSEADYWNSLYVLVRHGGYLVRMAGPSGDTDRFTPANFLCFSTWEGILPFSDRLRRVYLYQRAS